MFANKMIVQSTGITVLAGALLLTGCAGGPLSTREKGAGIGALGGAAAGGLIGAAVGHPGVGAAVGGGLGLGAGALSRDPMRREENTHYREQQPSHRHHTEIYTNRPDM